jgi:hypothetical protein
MALIHLLSANQGVAGGLVAARGGYFSESPSLSATGKTARETPNRVRSRAAWKQRPAPVESAVASTPPARLRELNIVHRARWTIGGGRLTLTGHLGNGVNWHYLANHAARLRLTLPVCVTWERVPRLDQIMPNIPANQLLFSISSLGFQVTL